MFHDDEKLICVHYSHLPDGTEYCRYSLGQYWPDRRIAYHKMNQTSMKNAFVFTTEDRIMRALKRTV